MTKYKIRNFQKNFRWNEALITDILPKVYLNFIQALICQNFDREKVYAALPTVESTLKNWQPLLQPFYHIQLLTEPFLWTLASGGQWISLSEAFFLSEDFGADSEILESVRTFLVDIGISVVDVPKPPLETIKKYLGNHIRSLGPKNLRNFCRQSSQSLNEQSFETKLNLLEYILSDGNYGDLTGLQLLPLDDGNFEVFDRQRKQIFIESENHPKSLLMPGFYGRFLNPNLSAFIKAHFVAATGNICELFL